MTQVPDTDKVNEKQSWLKIYTIGHSTRQIGELISLLKENGVKLLVDIRAIPKSKHNPQFASEFLRGSLRSAAIDYLHQPSLGGLRHARKDSINLGWRNASFSEFS